jgi:hypothetical protein
MDCAVNCVLQKKYVEDDDGDDSDGIIEYREVTPPASKKPRVDKVR